MFLITIYLKRKAATKAPTREEFIGAREIDSLLAAQHRSREARALTSTVFDFHSLRGRLFLQFPRTKTSQDPRRLDAYGEETRK